MSFGEGTVTMAYRPIPFGGSIDATQVLMSMGFGQVVDGPGRPIRPVPDRAGGPPVVCIDAPCPSDGGFGRGFDGMPEVEVFDLTSGEWRRLPHFDQGVAYALENPSDYVDATTGTIQVRFVNEGSDTVGFSFGLSIEGTIR